MISQAVSLGGADVHVVMPIGDVMKNRFKNRMIDIAIIRNGLCKLKAKGRNAGRRSKLSKAK